MSDREITSIGQYVEAMANVPNVAKVVSLQTTSGQERIHTLTTLVRGVDQSHLVVTWGEIADRSSRAFADSGYEIGAVLSEGHFDDMIHGSGKPREYTVLFDSSLPK